MNTIAFSTDIALWFSIACFAIAFYVISQHAIQLCSSVPEDDRRYQDQLPKGFAVIWPITRLMDFFFSRYLKIEFRKKLHQRLCQGGADYILTAEQYFFSHFAAGITMGLFAYGVCNLLETGSTALVIVLFLLGCNMPTSWLNQRIKKREKSILRQLPTYLDILTLAMESGSNFVGALAMAIEKSPPTPLKDEFGRVLRDIKAGKQKSHALNTLRERIKLTAINDFVTSILQAEKTGSPIGKILRAQADQRRFERFALAEKLGLEAPVKLLGPLVMFIFPTTFIILGFLIIIKLYLSNILEGHFIDLLMTDPSILLQQLLG